MTFSTKSSNQNFIIFLHKVQATVIGYKSCDFLAILDQLDPDTLSDGRIWLFGFNPYFFQHNSLCMGSTTKRAGLQDWAQMHFLVLFIMPLLVPWVTTELPGSTRTATLAYPVGKTHELPRVRGWDLVFHLYVHRQPEGFQDRVL
uniref:Uncharacterized protein n=1 Tax=Sciurus vulgaris TaxID=55149 RepID=A0A8D2DVA3_SCIVU